MNSTDGMSAMGALASLPERASAASVFGEPATAGDRVVIPVAEVMIAMGAGWGGGNTTEPTATSVPVAPAAGSGGGVGGWGRARGIAVIELGPDGVQVHPIVDQTAISLAGIALAGAVLALVAQVTKKLIR
ncbi:MAG: hypothetical protein DWI48_02355 [Chloroflexi bacterium]|nr:MAG: hypothetical protein DWI48_02355 [Chloroflexota bacterium]